MHDVCLICTLRALHMCVSMYVCARAQKGSKEKARSFLLLLSKLFIVVLVNGL